LTLAVKKLLVSRKGFEYAGFIYY